MSEGLAAWAVCEATSRGRRHSEAASKYRSEHERDRDRIIHSTAFRRLMYKTQVFVNHEGDLYRTRLTHSLEVAQIARTAARPLKLNESLVEAVAFAHDLGHTPFGHAGQDALNECMREHGGFEHNLQSLRVVDQLESRYADFPGLNLTFESREGILKHCSARNARELGDVGQRFLDRHEPSLEAQLVDIADAIAYNHHDVDDGVRAGLLSLDVLAEEALFGDAYEDVKRRYPGLEDRRVLYEVIRRMIDTVVTDLVETTRDNLNEAEPSSVDDVRRAGRRLVAFGERIGKQHRSLKRFLYANLYKHDQVLEMQRRAAHVVTTLFQRYLDDPQQMSPEFAARTNDATDTERARAVADYIAGMTDRFAMREFDR